jgi:cytochrome c oxidase subunit 2
LDQDKNHALPVTLVIGVAILAGVLAIGVALLKRGPAPAASGGGSPALEAPPEIRAALQNEQAPSGSLVRRVYFDTGSAAVGEDGQAAIANAARTLSAGLAARIALSGFVDATGSADVNAELAKQRAFAVRDALVAAGVPADAIELRKPQQVTAAGAADEARRVEILLLR